MAGEGINIYPGYTGILCLYHHITKHVIVQWTGLDGVDQQVKLDTEENLLSFFKDTVDVSNEDGIDNIAVDEMSTVDVDGLHVRVAESNNSQTETVEYGVEPDHTFSDIAATADIDTLDTSIKDEPSDYAPTDMGIDDQIRMREMRVTLDMMENTISNSVVEASVPKASGSISTALNEATGDSSEAAVEGESTARMGSEAVSTRLNRDNRKYNKRYVCYICNKPVAKLPRHLQTHKEVKDLDLQQYLQSKNEETRRQLITKIRNRGQHEHNLKALAEGGVIHPVYRSNNSCAQNLNVCKYCFGWYSKSELWRHVSRCPCKPNTHKARDISSVGRKLKHLVYASSTSLESNITNKT